MILHLQASGEKNGKGKQCSGVTSTHRLDLARVNFNDPDPRGDQLPSQRVRERPDSSLCCTINTPARIALASSDAADHNDIAASAVGTAILVLENRKHGLRHVDQARDIRGKHDIDILGLDVGSLVHTLDETRVVH